MDNLVPIETYEVIEVVESLSYNEILNQIYTSLQSVEYSLQILAGFGLFFIVVCLCYFCYKFFRIFF